MGKILFIEDELTKSIATILKLFEPIFMDSRTVRLLEELENDSYKTPELIIEACQYTSGLDICHTYVNALACILNNYRDYDLIIIDRNLSEQPYHKDIEDIKQYLSQGGFNDPENKIDYYRTREGDLLLLLLLRFDKANKKRIYYLTANLDELRGSPELRTLIDVDDFFENHIIEKSPDRENELRNIISDLDSFAIQNRFTEQCEILRTRLNEEEVNHFINMIRHFEADSRREFIVYLRKLLDNILHDLAFKMKEPQAGYWNRANKTQLIVKTFIKGHHPGGRDKEFMEPSGLPVFDQKHGIGYGSIIRDACLSIFEICSDCGIHDLNPSIAPNKLNIDSLTDHTMNSLLHQICDVILWYEKAIDLITPTG